MCASPPLPLPPSLPLPPLILVQIEDKTLHHKKIMTCFTEMPVVAYSEPSIYPSSLPILGIVILNILS